MHGSGLYFGFDLVAQFMLFAFPQLMQLGQMRTDYGEHQLHITVSKTQRGARCCKAYNISRVVKREYLTFPCNFYLPILITLIRILLFYSTGSVKVTTAKLQLVITSQHSFCVQALDRAAIRQGNVTNCNEPL